MALLTKVKSIGGLGKKTKTKIPSLLFLKVELQTDTSPAFITTKPDIKKSSIAEFSIIKLDCSSSAQKLMPYCPPLIDELIMVEEELNKLRAVPMTLPVTVELSKNNLPEFIKITLLLIIPSISELFIET